MARKRVKLKNLERRVTFWEQCPHYDPTAIEEWIDWEPLKKFRHSRTMPVVLETASETCRYLYEQDAAAQRMIYETQCKKERAVPWACKLRKEACSKSVCCLFCPSLGYCRERVFEVNHCPIFKVDKLDRLVLLGEWRREFENADGR